MQKNLKFKTLSSWLQKAFLETIDLKIKIVKNMIEAFRFLGSRINLKLHFLHSYFAFFADYLGVVSDEHCERFHQDVAAVEKRYKGKSNVSMMRDYG